MNEDTTSQVRVNFGRPFPLFPLDGVVLLPHAMLRLFVFEPRYRQMTEAVLDGSGQIAMAVFDGEDWTEEYLGNPPICPAVCIGQIAHHERLADGTYRLWLQGICRARIVEELEPEDERLYRAAMLEPIGETDIEEHLLHEHRRTLDGLLHEQPLRDLACVQRLHEQLQEQVGGLDEVPTSVLDDVIALSLLAGLERPGVMYRLLEESSPEERAKLVESELRVLSRLLEHAARQYDPDAPSGISWN
jgi:Lon protease-like protein